MVHISTGNAESFSKGFKNGQELYALAVFFPYATESLAPRVGKHCQHSLAAVSNLKTTPRTSVYEVCKMSRRKGSEKVKVLRSLEC